MNVEKHLNTKLSCSLENLRGLWSNWTDNQRLEVIKSIIFAAPDMSTFKEKILKEVAKLEGD